MSALKFRKRLTKFKTKIILPKKFGSMGFLTAVKVTKIWRSSGESNKSRYVYPIWGMPGDIAIQKRDIDYIKIKIVPFIINYLHVIPMLPTKSPWCFQVSSQLPFWFRRRSENRFSRWPLWPPYYFSDWNYLTNLIYKSSLWLLHSFMSSGFSIQKKKAKTGFQDVRHWICDRTLF